MIKRQFHPATRSKVITVLLVAALLVAWGPCQAVTSWAATPQVCDSYADLVQQVQQSVVNISTTRVVKGFAGPFLNPQSPFRDFFGDQFFKHFFGNIPQEQMKTHALGSGFVIDSSGLILTNNHVIEKATEITVKLQDGHEYKAKVLGRDPKTDLALLKVKPDKDFPKALKLGDSDAIRVGDRVIAVGNPFGLGHTVTAGIISAKGRIIGAGPYDDFLQTDAAINPGNSGGPLFNMKGEVIGINTAIIAQGQGIGFAIPINMAKELLPQLKSGTIVRGWLGVMIQDITPQLAKSFNLKTHKGALIGDVMKDGPAYKAGLKRGDVIVAFAGKPVPNAHELSRLVASRRPKSRVTVTVIRNGRKKDIEVILGTMPQQEAVQPQGQAGNWGLSVQTLTADIATRLGLDTSVKGVVITNVIPGSPAAMAGLHSGDVILEVNRHRVNNLHDYQKAIRGSAKEGSVLFLVQRRGRTFYVVLEVKD